MLEALTLVMSALGGATIGRWWSVVLAVPAGFVASSTFTLEGFSDAEVGLLFGVAVAVGLIAGVAVRKTVDIRLNH